jgi:hypothetical protein
LGGSGKFPAQFPPPESLLIPSTVILSRAKDPR